VLSPRVPCKIYPCTTNLPLSRRRVCVWSLSCLAAWAEWKKGLLRPKTPKDVCVASQGAESGNQTRGEDCSLLSPQMSVWVLGWALLGPISRKGTLRHTNYKKMVSTQLDVFKWVKNRWGKIIKCWQKCNSRTPSCCIAVRILSV